MARFQGRHVAGIAAKLCDKAKSWAHAAPVGQGAGPRGHGRRRDGGLTAGCPRGARPPRGTCVVPCAGIRPHAKPDAGARRSDSRVRVPRRRSSRRAASCR